MSLPPGFLDELRTRTSLSQVVGRKVMWDARKSNQGKGDMWAPCPFHQEKTASFHVDDRKGFYYCFGCHAKGDAISFVKDTENVDFMEAVRILAAEAGMQMPDRDPQAQAKADRASQLAEVMELAVKHFKLQLKTGAGAAARDYLAGRRLAEATQERFEIGFAPDAWQGLWDHLKAKGVDDQMILDAGLAKPSQKGGKPYDTFRGRIMFPIRDARGRCIAFGGRAMDPNDNAKYLNSPETALFDKSRTLYNHGPAREACGKGQPLIVAEGYMDVIALSEGGFTASVAPLGTAVTETQLQMLWRMADEPIIALDGDTAGLRAAHRVIDLALPLLEAGKSLRFALMPEGQDPDDLIRAEGPGAVQAVLDRALPMVQLLWNRETEGRVFDSPERKAALDKALREKILLIRDPSIRSHYGQAIKDMRWELFSRRAPAQPRSGPRRKWNAPDPATPAAKASLLVAAGEAATIQMREAVILATAALCPDVVEEFEHALEAMDCTNPDHARLRDVILHHADTGAESLALYIEQKIGADALEKLLRLPHVALAPSVRRPAEQEIARMTMAEELAKLDAHRGLAAEISEASEDISHVADESVTYRLHQAAEARNRALRSEQEDRAEYDLADNGARLKREEKARLDALLNEIKNSEPGR
ncbi:DNA primase [Roseovarius faecimaris]|uniref:DNA primase n=1 Tax=Roseovarius faecimaris TaxID=2494550 RepID=A0A6I6J2P1_9RHOB|nr:DNA primase [Roseovarius faecimaris]QGX99038.1 DNA primase [Roseovarius faecimaris]